MTQDVGGDRRGPGESGADTLDLPVAEPAIAAPLNIKVGDRVRYTGTTGAVREAEVLEIPDDRHVVIRRPRPTSERWNSDNGGVWPIRRERIVEVVHHV